VREPFAAVFFLVIISSSRAARTVEVGSLSYPAAGQSAVLCCVRVLHAMAAAFALMMNIGC